MKLDDLRRDSSPDAPKNRILVPLLLGSFALHLLVWRATARLPVPPAEAPETPIEVRLDDLPAPKVAPRVAPKLQATPAIRSETPLLAKAPRAPRRVQPTPPNPPRPELREVAPTALTAPLVRSKRAVAKTGVIAERPLAEQPLVPRPTAVAQTRAPAPLPRRAPDAIVSRPQKSTPAIETPSDKSAPLAAPDADEAQRNANQKSASADSSQSPGGASKSRSEREKRAGSGAASGSVGGPTNNTSNNDMASLENARSSSGAANSSGGGGLFGLGSGPFGIGRGTDKKPRPNEIQSDKPSPLPGAGANKGTAAGRGNGSGTGRKNDGERAGNNGAGGKNGSGGGPFGIGGDAGEGPRRIVYILDISYSMEPRFERAKRELRDALSGLQPGESFNIIGVYGNVKPFESRLVEATPRNIDKSRAFVDSLRLGRYTNLETAFEQAFAAPDVNVIVVITDGVPTYGLGSPDFSEDGAPDISANFGKLARRVRQLNRAGARIYTVGLTGKKGEKFEAAGLLQRIATESGGTFVTVRIDARPRPDAP